MPDLTTNLGLEKGRGPENWSNPQLNRNWDKIDAAFAKLGIKNAWDSSRIAHSKLDFFTADSQVTIDRDNSYVQRMGMMCYAEIYFNFKAAKTVPTNGNLSNLLIGNLKPGFRAVEAAPFLSGATGRLTMGYVSSSGGNLYMVSTAPGSNITTTEKFTLLGNYMLE